LVDPRNGDQISMKEKSHGMHQGYSRVKNELSLVNSYMTLSICNKKSSFKQRNVLFHIPYSRYQWETCVNSISNLLMLGIKRFIFTKWLKKWNFWKTDCEIFITIYCKVQIYFKIHSNNCQTWLNAYHIYCIWINWTISIPYEKLPNTFNKVSCELVVHAMERLRMAKKLMDMWLDLCFKG
jgi:hypothetical protein